MPRFTVLRDGRVERSLTVLLDEIAIGRVPGAHVELPDPTVSRRHARVRLDGRAWVLEDLGSMNGVHVGGRRVRRHELRRGDRFAIEGYELVFEPPDELYDAGLAAGHVERSGPHSFSMTYVSAGGFTASAKVARSAGGA